MQFESLLDVPEPLEDQYLVEDDRENTTKINKQISVHHVPGALFGHYCIYGEGAPFERLFFQARDQLVEATKTLANERAQREYEEEDEFDDRDCSFINCYLELRKQNSLLEDSLFSARFQRDQLRYRVERLGPSAQKWRRRYKEAVGDHFVDCPRSV